jgi:hypothetical protein
MGPQRSDEWVTIATSRREVRVPWPSQQALLGRVRGLSREKEIVDEFKAAGTSRDTRALGAGRGSDIRGELPVSATTSLGCRSRYSEAPRRRCRPAPAVRGVVVVTPSEWS